MKEFILSAGRRKQGHLVAAGGERALPSIIVVDPSLVMPGYAPQSLRRPTAKRSADPDPDDLCWLAVAVIRKKLEDSVVSLKSPIAINVKNRVGMQVILDDEIIPLRYRLFAQSGGR